MGEKIVIDCVNNSKVELGKKEDNLREVKQEMI